MVARIPQSQPFTGPSGSIRDTIHAIFQDGLRRMVEEEMPTAEVGPGKLLGTVIAGKRAFLGIYGEPDKTKQN